MGIKRYKPEEIILKLRQVEEVLCSQGKSMAEAIRHIGVSVLHTHRIERFLMR